MVEPTFSSRPKRSSAAAGAVQLARQAQQDGEDSGDSMEAASDDLPPPSSLSSTARPSFDTVDSPRKVVKKGRATYGGAAKKKARASAGGKGKVNKVELKKEGDVQEDDEGNQPSSMDTDVIVEISISKSSSPPLFSKKNARKWSPSSPAAPAVVKRAPAPFSLDTSSSQPAPSPSSAVASSSKLKRTPTSALNDLLPPARGRKATASKKKKRTASADDSSADELPPFLPSRCRNSSPRRKAASPGDDGNFSSPFKGKKVASSKAGSSKSGKKGPPPIVAPSSSLSSVGPSRSFLSFGGSQGASKVVIPDGKWSLRELKKVVWVRLEADGALYVEGDAPDDERSRFWWPALRETPDKELSRNSCSVRLFQLQKDARGKPLGSPLTLHHLSASTIVNLFTGQPRTYRFSFATFSDPPSASPSSSPGQFQPSSSTSTLLTLDSVTKTLFESVLKLAHREMSDIEAEDLFSSDDLDGEVDEERAEVRAAKKGKAREDMKAQLRATKTEGDGIGRKKSFMEEANEIARARMGSAGAVSEDEIDAPKFSPDNDTRRVFVFNEHAWWGALITAPGKKNERGDWTYACKLVHGKVFKAVREDKITSRDQLPLIHDQPWGTYLSQAVQPEDDDFQHASVRPRTPEPTAESSSRPFEDLTMSEQLVRCRPTLERIIKGEYPPAVKAHREATSEGGLRLNMARDAVGYGMLSEKEVEESVLPELQRWALRSIGPEEAKMAGEDGMESMARPPRPIGDEAYERLSKSSREKYVSGFLLQQALVELVILEHGLRDAPAPQVPLDTPAPEPAADIEAPIPVAAPSPLKDDVAEEPEPMVVDEEVPVVPSPPSPVPASVEVEVTEAVLDFLPPAPAAEDESSIVKSPPAPPPESVLDLAREDGPISSASCSSLPPQSSSLLDAQPELSTSAPSSAPSPAPADALDDEASPSVASSATLHLAARSPSPAAVPAAPHPSPPPADPHSQLLSPSYSPSLQYPSLLSHFPSPSHQPQSAQLAHAAHEIALYETGLALFLAEEPTDPFWWVRPEYSQRLGALEAGWRRRNEQRRREGKEGEEERGELMRVAREQCGMEDEGEEDEGDGGEKGVDGEGAEVERRSSRRRVRRKLDDGGVEQERSSRGRGEGKRKGGK